MGDVTTIIIPVSNQIPLNRLPLKDDVHIFCLHSSHDLSHGYWTNIEKQYLQALYNSNRPCGLYQCIYLKPPKINHLIDENILYTKVI